MNPHALFNCDNLVNCGRICQEKPLAPWNVREDGRECISGLTVVSFCHTKVKMLQRYHEAVSAPYLKQCTQPRRRRCKPPASSLLQLWLALQRRLETTRAEFSMGICSIKISLVTMPPPSSNPPAIAENGAFQ